MWKTMELANTVDPKDGTTVVETAADRVCTTLNALGVRPEHVTIIPTASTRDMAYGDEGYRVFYFVEEIWTRRGISSDQHLATLRQKQASDGHQLTVSQQTNGDWRVSCSCGFEEEVRTDLLNIPEALKEYHAEGAGE